MADRGYSKLLNGVLMVNRVGRHVWEVVEVWYKIEGLWSDSLVLIDPGLVLRRPRAMKGIVMRTRKDVTVRGHSIVPACSNALRPPGLCLMSVITARRSRPAIEIKLKQG